MSDKLQEIMAKIYNEGVQKAKNEAEVILKKADSEASQIVEQAKLEAGRILKDSENESAALRQKIESEIRMAGMQAVSLLKQEIVGLLSGSVLDLEIKTAFDDPEFTKKLLAEMLSKGNFSGDEIDMNITLPERFRDELNDFLKTNVSHILTSGVEITFQSRMNGGFKIGPKDKSFVLSFTDQDFLKYFQSFLKPRAKEILFPKG